MQGGPLNACPESDTIFYPLGHSQPHTIHWLGGSRYMWLPQHSHTPTPMCAPCSDMLALRLACIGDEMDVSLRAPRLAQLSEVAMHR